MQTNNRAEFAAFIRDLQISKVIDKNGHCPQRVHTDSRLLIDSVEKYSAEWRANGWITAEGESVKNRDLLETIQDLMTNDGKQPTVVEFVHVSAQSGDTTWTARWNHEADVRARAAATSAGP